MADRLREYIDSRLTENIGLEAIVEMAGLSVFHFVRVFRQSLGMPPDRYLLHRRIERAENPLQETDLPLSEIAFSSGFPDQCHFSRHFRRLTGMTPGTARWNRQ
jgi:AraC family transcriptional regulator